MYEKIIMLLCFAVNAGLVAGDDTWKVLPDVSDFSNYALNPTTNVLSSVANPKDKDGIFSRTYDHCLEKAKDGDGCLVIRDKVYAEFNQFLNVGCQIGSQKGIQEGKQLAGIKDVFMASTKTQKFGYVCVGVLAVYGAVQAACAIRNRLRKTDESRNTVD